MRILFVCLGNICRSPTAEGVFRHLAKQRGIDDKITVDSAGTAAYHIDAPTDQRAQDAAKQRGIDLSQCRGRQINHQDFIDFDFIIAMDRSNLVDLQYLADPTQHKKIRLLLEFVSVHSSDEVPDPYYGGESGFDLVIDMIEEASSSLLDHVEQMMSS